MFGGAKKAAKPLTNSVHQPGDTITPTGPTQVDDHWHSVPNPYGSGAPVKNTVWGAQNQRIDITSTGAVVETAAGGTPNRIGYVNPAQAASFSNPAQVRANLLTQNNLATTGVADHGDATHAQAAPVQSVGIGVSTPVADHTPQHLGVSQGTGVGVSTPVADAGDPSRTRSIPVTDASDNTDKARQESLGLPHTQVATSSTVADKPDVVDTTVTGGNSNNDTTDNQNNNPVANTGVTDVANFQPDYHQGAPTGWDSTTGITGLGADASVHDLRGGV